MPLLQLYQSLLILNALLKLADKARSGGSRHIEHKRIWSQVFTRGEIQLLYQDIAFVAFSLRVNLADVPVWILFAPIF